VINKVLRILDAFQRQEGRRTRTHDELLKAGVLSVLCSQPRRVLVPRHKPVSGKSKHWAVVAQGHAPSGGSGSRPPHQGGESQRAARRLCRCRADNL